LYFNFFYSCDQSWIFCIISPVFSVTWSFRNQSNMMICCSRNIYYYQCWKLLSHIFVETMIHFFFPSGFLNEYKVKKNSIYLKYNANNAFFIVTCAGWCSLVCDFELQIRVWCRLLKSVCWMRMLRSVGCVRRALHGNMYNHADERDWAAVIEPHLSCGWKCCFC